MWFYTLGERADAVQVLRDAGIKHRLDPRFKCVRFASRQDEERAIDACRAAGVMSKEIVARALNGPSAQ